MFSKIKFAFAAAVLSLGLSAASACPGHDDDNKSAGAPKTQQVPAKDVAVATFHVDGMHCEGCADEVKDGLAKNDGIVTVDVAFADKRVVVKYDKTKLSPDKIAKILGGLGFTATAEA
jgi:copper chaperone CopZ